MSETDSNPAQNSAAHGGCPAVPCSPVVALRMALGREHNYWRDTSTAPFRERVYQQFARLEYQTADGKWHPVPQVWVGQFDGEYLPENAELTHPETKP